MSGWASAAPQIGLALLVLFVPGAVLLVAAGAPWRRALALAPATSVGLVGLIGVAAAIVGVRFGLPVTAAATVAGAVVLLLIRLALRRLPLPERFRSRNEPAEPDEGTGGYAFLSALGLAVVVLAVRLGAALGGPERLSQTFDAVFHLNTTRYIVESGDGSSLNLLGWGTGTGGFYPAAWHDLAALATVHGDVVAATQALGLVVGAVVWPLSVLVLVRRLVGSGWMVMLGTAAVLGGFGTFPARMLDYGVLYPFLLGIALMPALLAVAHIATARPEERGSFRGLAVLVSAGFGTVGLALAHAGVLLAFLLVAFPLAVRWAFRAGRAQWARGRRVLTVVATVGAVAVLLVMARVLDTSPTIAQMRLTNWPTIGSPSQAVGAWLLVSPHQLPIPWVVAGLVIVGICVAISTRGLRWLVVSHALMAIPYVFAAGVESGLSQRITGFWYNDSTRLGALVAVTAMPLAGVGLAWLTGQVRRYVPPLLARRPQLPSARRLAPVAVAVATLALLAGSIDTPSRVMYDSLARHYQLRSTALVGTLLTADELKLIERLPDEVAPGSVVAANPWDGSGFAYAISGVRVLVPQLGARPAGEAKVVAEGLARATEDPAVCEAVRDLDVRYVLDFGPPMWIDYRAESYPGLEGLFTSPAVKLIDSQGRARLYEVTACGNAP